MLPQYCFYLRIIFSATDLKKKMGGSGGKGVFVN